MTSPPEGGGHFELLLCAGLRRASYKAQASFMTASLKSVAGFRCSRWPWQSAYADRLDSLQRHIIGCMRPLGMGEDEEFAAYARRRHVHCEQIASSWGKWSKSWALDVMKWNDHISRANDKAHWGKPLREWHGAQWLQDQRFANNRGNSWSRTGTRASAGRPATRWHEGIAAAKARWTSA